MSDMNKDQDTEDPFDLEREPLDDPNGSGIDWGGDGSDLERTVRAHVLAALRPSTGPYAPPLDALLSLGEVEDKIVDRRAATLGIGQQHVPELVRMVRDRALATADSSNPVVYAPEHAMHLLEHLDISEVVTDLIPVFDIDSDVLPYQLINAIAQNGATALVPTIGYLNSRTQWVYGRSYAAQAVQKIAEQHPYLRAAVISILREILVEAETEHEIVNTSVVGALIELRTTDSVTFIRHAFEIGKLDEMVYGSWDDVLDELGLEPDEDDPLLEASDEDFDAFQNEPSPPSLLDYLTGNTLYAPSSLGQGAAPQKPKQVNTSKQKQKRKIAKASRKANRKKGK